MIVLILLLFTSACVQPASTPVPFAGRNPFTPEAAAHLCAAADLQTSSSASVAAGIVVIGITVINQAKEPCNLPPPAKVDLYNAGQLLDVETVQAKADAITLSISAGESVILAVGWRNYCGNAPPSNPEIRLTLAKGQTLKIPTQFPSFPPCEDAKTPSTFTLNSYSYPP